MTSATKSKRGRWRKKQWLFTLAIGALLLLGAYLRIAGRDYDNLHAVMFEEQMVGHLSAGLRLPRNIYSYFDTVFSPSNPYFLNIDRSYPVYGTFHLLTLKFISGEFGSNNPQYILEVGRVLSACISWLSIFLVYLVGLRFCGKRTALFASFLWLFSPIAIQQAHSALPLALFTLFALLVVFAAIEIAENGSFRDYLFAGIALGFCFALDPRGILLTIPILLALLLHLTKSLRNSEQESLRHRLLSKPVGYFCVGAVSCLIGFSAIFRVLEPYAFTPHSLLDLHPMFLSVFLRRFLHPIDMLYSVDYFAKSLGSLQLLLGPLIIWGLTPLVAISSLIGILFSLKANTAKSLVLISIPLTFLIYCLWNRFSEPQLLFPTASMLLIYAAFGLTSLMNYSQNRLETVEIDSRQEKNAVRLKLFVSLFVLIALFFPAVWGLSFASVYRKESPRFLASKWISAHLPVDSVVMTEQGDVRLPGFVHGRIPGPYRYAEIPILSAESFEKADSVLGSLRATDMIILSSNRGAWRVLNDSANYPYMSQLYRQLANGSLGFSLAAAFHNFPRFLSHTVRTNLAHPGLTFREQPPVWIFKRTKKLTLEELADTIPYPPERKTYTYKDFLLDMHAAEKRLSKNGS